jgi:hypothetical protein
VQDHCPFELSKELEGFDLILVRMISIFKEISHDDNCKHFNLPFILLECSNCMDFDDIPNKLLITHGFNRVIRLLQSLVELELLFRKLIKIAEGMAMYLLLFHQIMEVEVLELG